MNSKNLKVLETRYKSVLVARHPGKTSVILETSRPALG